MIGFYVHHCGRGHLARTQAILAHLDCPATVLTSAEIEEGELGRTTLVELPLDVAPGPTPSSMHYAPLNSPGLRRRMALIAAWAEREQPQALVVDVSVEVAVLARLLGIPVVMVRQHGDRRDLAHRIGFDMAGSLLAPYPEVIEDPTTDPSVRERTCYAGLFSRFDGRSLDRSTARHRLGIAVEDRLVVVVNGAGGPGRDLDSVQRAGSATPGWRWLLIGGDVAVGSGATGWIADPYCHLRAADVVVAAGGHNTVAEVLAADRPLICVPEDRPFGEQHAKASALEQVGAAVVTTQWPPPDAWTELLERALALDPAVRACLADGLGAPRAAAHVQAVAAGAQA